MYFGVLFWSTCLIKSVLNLYFLQQDRRVFWWQLGVTSDHTGQITQEVEKSDLAAGVRSCSLILLCLSYIWKQSRKSKLWPFGVRVIQKDRGSWRAIKDLNETSYYSYTRHLVSCIRNGTCSETNSPGSVPEFRLLRRSRTEPETKGPGMALWVCGYTQTINMQDSDKGNVLWALSQTESKVSTRKSSEFYIRRPQVVPGIGKQLVWSDSLASLGLSLPLTERSSRTAGHKFTLMHKAAVSVEILSGLWWHHLGPP